MVKVVHTQVQILCVCVQVLSEDKLLIYLDDSGGCVIGDESSVLQARGIQVEESGRGDRRQTEYKEEQSRQQAFHALGRLSVDKLQC